MIYSLSTAEETSFIDSSETWGSNAYKRDNGVNGNEIVQLQKP